MSTPIEFTFDTFSSPSLGRIDKPFARVRFISRQRIFDVKLLIDSGADVTLLPRGIGIRLGLQKPAPQELTQIGGISGGVTAVYRNIFLGIENIVFPCQVAWVQNEKVPPVLGRADIFDRFHVEFKKSEGQILFQPV